MAVAARDRRFTRSRKTTVPDGLGEKPETRSLRSNKAATSGLGKKSNCIVVITKLKSETTKFAKNKEDSKRRTPGRKRTRVDNEDENEVEEETKAKVTLLYSFFLFICS